VAAQAEARAKADEESRQRWLKKPPRQDLDERRRKAWPKPKPSAP
jgi:hypothetical protein